MPVDPKSMIFSCRQCGYCCCGDHGYIWVTEEEIEEIARLLRLRIRQVKKKYVKKVGDKLSLRETRFGESYDCIFYDRNKKSCHIYSVRPEQCRTYPYWESILADYSVLKMTEQECPGLTVKE